MELTLALALSAIATAAHAQSRWIYSLAVPVDLEHDSNPLLSSTHSVPVSRARATPEFRARYQLDRDEFEINGAVVLERSTNSQVSADRNDPRMRAGWRHTLSVASYGLYAAFEERAYRSVDADIRAPREVDGTRRLASVGGDWSYTIGPKTTLSASGREERVTFDTPQAADYHLSAANVQFAAGVDERAEWYASADASSYRPTATPGLPGSTEDSASFGVLAGYRRALAETWDMDLAAGVVRFTGPSADTSWQGIAKLLYSATRLQARLEAGRRPGVSTGTSSLSLTSVASVALRYALDELSGLGVEATASRFHAEEVSRATYLIASYDRRLAPFWTLTARAQYRARSDQAGSAHANVVSLTLTYSRPDF